MPYRLHLLGRVQLLNEGRPVESLAGHRQKLALLAHLATQPELRATRERLVALFWPERDESSARHSLSELIYELRKEVGDLVEATRATVGLRADELGCDAREFREAAEGGDGARACGLYAGDFLAEFNTSVSPEFERWAEDERDQLRRTHRRACRELVAALRDRGDFEGAIAAARRWLEIDPYEDEAHHELIELLARSGARAAALAQFDRYTKLCREMEVEPLDETRELVEGIRAGAPSLAPAVRDSPARPAAYTGAAGADAVPGAVPAPVSEAPAVVFDRPPRDAKALLRELKKRHVLEVLALYVGAAVLALWAFGPTRGWFAGPGWARYLFYAAIVLGLPIIVALAWARVGSPRGVPGLAPVLVLARERIPGAVRWATRIRSTDLMGLLGITILGLIAALVFVPPVLPAQKSLAVLPFRAVGDDAETRAFADGLMETVTSQLAQMEHLQGALWVVAASEVRERGVTSPSLARAAFGVTLVVTDSVQRDGETVRVTLNVVDPRSALHVRSGVLDERLANLAALQDGIVVQLARMLEIELRPEDRSALAAGATQSPSAYDFYLQGRGYLQRFEREENVDLAIELFGRALERDSTYALAYAGLGEAYKRKYDVAKDPDWVEKARAASRIALRLNDRLAPVHVTLGMLHTTTGRYEEAVQAFRRALENDRLNPDAHRGLARAYLALGQIDAAEETYRRAIELKPGYWLGYSQLGWFHYRQARFAEAADQFRKVIELVPDNPVGYRSLGAMLHQLGRYAEAEAMYRRSLELEPTDVIVYSNLATLYFYLGRYAEAARTYEQALRIDDRDHRVWHNLASAYYWAPGEREKARPVYQRVLAMVREALQVNPRDPVLVMRLADCYAMLDRADEARQHVKRALELAPHADAELLFRAGDIYEHLGDRERALEFIGSALRSGYPLAEIERAPGLDSLRGDPRFEALTREAATSTEGAL